VPEPNAGRRGADLAKNKERPPAHPPEPGYPCCISVLGELAWMAPRGEPSTSLAAHPSSRDASANPAPIVGFGLPEALY
jgi:hypothetical protein